MEAKLIAIAHSPKQKLQLEVQQSGSDLSFSLIHGGCLLFDRSSLGLDFVGGGKEPITLTWTDMCAMPEDGVELMTTFSRGAEWFVIRFLLRDDCLSFRYELYNTGDRSVVGEKTCFHFGPDANFLIDQDVYKVVDARGLKLPVLLEMDNGLYVGVRRTPSLSSSEPMLRLKSGRHLEVLCGTERESKEAVGHLITPWWILAITQP